MQNAIKVEIKKLAIRSIKREIREKKKIKDYKNRYEKRTGLKAGNRTVYSSSKLRHFDPIYCSRNANFLSKTLWYKILNYQYEVQPALYYEIKKEGGGSRPIMAFSIPDAALANVVMRRCRERNLKNFSSYSFAYHPNKSLFDAIIELKRPSFSGKIFAIQIDFEKYFDNIPKKYILDQLNDRSQIIVTGHEKHVFEQFLSHRFAKPDKYRKLEFKRRYKGTPQGSSVSLLLANLANNKLDRSLETGAGKFVRFADDVVSICGTYEEALEVEEKFHAHCKNSGLIINKKKSPGISILSDEEKEIRTSEEFVYLGYNFTEKGLSVPDQTVVKIKSKISRLVNIYLLHYLADGFSSRRAAVHPHQYDWDLLGLIYELRRSLYGGLSESDISNFINGGAKLSRMKGLMSFYSLIDDPEKFKHLDGWMLSIIRRAMKRRSEILISKYQKDCPLPNNRSLATGDWLDPAAWAGGNQPEPRVPSFVRGWRASRKYYFTYGLKNVFPPRYASLTDLSYLFEYKF